ncbi:MAG: helix-turn-helix domain-containing protein, partial [Hyphomicrobiaceae bacterium]
LKDVRLDKARSRLSKGDRNASVTKVAMDSGFGHLGAFGADYRKKFGEPPSQTLQRSQRQREMQRSQHH